MEERLQKLIARSGRCSRREAETLISAGLVTVNGRIASLGDRADPETDAIKVEGRLLRPGQEHRYLLLNKPKGVVATARDPEGRMTVIDLLGRRIGERLYPVGRLDIQTEGLLLLTNDGDFALRITHPSYGCAKEYEVKVRGEVDEKKIRLLRRGVRLDDGTKTSPAEIDLIRTTRPRTAGGEGNSWFRVVLREGRNHQVRRMFETVGHPVLKLKRVAVGPLRDDRLPVGSWRELSPREIESIRKLGSRGKKKATRRTT